MKSIKDIENTLKLLYGESLLTELESLKKDSRLGVKTLITRYTNKYNKNINELKRLELINEYENKHYNNNCKFIAGVDEVGRGPLAGPILACAVILPRDTKIIGINDSKKLTSIQKHSLYKKIKDIAIDIKISFIDNKTIDKINILNANFLAMSKAINKLNYTPDIILIDGYKIPSRFITITQESIIKGDAKSISIAAASIVAKVTRDNLMIKLHDKYPMYDFKNNKGYGTEKHIYALKKYGPCEIHRSSFLERILK